MIRDGGVAQSADFVDGAAVSVGEFAGSGFDAAAASASSFRQGCLAPLSGSPGGVRMINHFKVCLLGRILATSTIEKVGAGRGDLPCSRFMFLVVKLPLSCGILRICAAALGVAFVEFVAGGGFCANVPMIYSSWFDWLLANLGFLCFSACMCFEGWLVHGSMVPRAVFGFGCVFGLGRGRLKSRGSFMKAKGP